MQFSDLATYSILLIKFRKYFRFSKSFICISPFFQSDEEVLKNLDQVNELNRLKTEASQAQSDLETKKERPLLKSILPSSIEGLKQLIADNKATLRRWKEKRKKQSSFSPLQLLLMSDSKQTNQVAPSTSVRIRQLLNQ